jgi:hypothetical protein
MKLIQVFTLWRGCALLLMALASGCWLVPGEAVPQEQEQERPKSPAPATEMQVIPAKFIKARELAHTIQEVLGKTPGHVLSLSADERSNSVVVLASREDLALVKDLVSKLDAPPARSKPPVSVRVFNLQYTQADAGLARALNMILGGGFELDQKRNLVIVSGDEKTIDAAQTFIQRLDEPAGTRRAPEPIPTQVRLVWLASGLTRKEMLKPPEDLKEVVAELAKMGVEEPRLITQMLVTGQSGAEFRVDGVAGHEEPYRLSVYGTVYAEPGVNPRLRISINATRATGKPPTEADRISRLDTEINAPLRHPVVLGMTPTPNSTSVFVVQILPKK